MIKAGNLSLEFRLHFDQGRFSRSSCDRNKLTYPFLDTREERNVCSPWK